MILVLTPMEAEIWETVRRFDAVQAGSLKTGGRLWTASAHSAAPEDTLLFAVGGVGKVNAALSVQEIIHRFSPTAILCGGIAGALSTKITWGEVLLVAETLQWDMDARAVKVPWGSVPHSSAGKIALDRELRRSTAEVLSAGHAQGPGPALGQVPVLCREGLTVCGDRFLGRDDEEEKRKIGEQFGALAVDMEDWSVAYTAALHGIPAVIVRIIVDMAGEKGPVDIRSELSQASKKLARIFGKQVEAQKF
jgi:adenosylhomocysteine nucleosidase